jgi:uncharacterized protein (UPF0332 family)
VKPEAASFLEKAQTLLSEAEAIFAIHLNEAAGRTAYLAGFHAAQAFIFEHTGKSPKTHRGVHTEFLRLTKDDPRLDADLRPFLSTSYNLKSIADYETGTGAKVSVERTTTTIEAGKRFVAWIVKAVGSHQA